MKQVLLTNFFKTIEVVKEKNDMKEICVDKYTQDYIVNIVNISDISSSSSASKFNNWYCLECGENMGDNPRQLCGKSYCYNNC